MKPKKSYYVFRLVSNRGTDVIRCVEFPKELSKSEARLAADAWANKIICNSSITECTVSYRQIWKTKKPYRASLLKKYTSICQKKAKIEEEWKTMAAMLNPQKGVR